ncbi:serine hydrolase domain-containing protein [Nonomuraea sp. NPDC001023]|uniref:serine hydrolase domain-containing protein n=1 Tax=Nonomuraea sp. NPDC001023 TaxID=3154770 RepID=UPI0033242331
MTIRHLLTHTGGFLGDIDDGESWDTGALAASIGTYDQLPQLFPPDALASYNNAGFRLLGRGIEVVCGEPYESAVSRIVLEPLGMSSSFFFPWEAATRSHAVGHTLGEDGPQVAHTWGLFREGMPEGGLVSSVRDQLRARQGAGQAGDRLVPGASARRQAAGRTAGAARTRAGVRGQLRRGAVDLRGRRGSDGAIRAATRAGGRGCGGHARHAARAGRGL